jgi:hypothetical protein
MPEIFCKGELKRTAALLVNVLHNIKWICPKAYRNWCGPSDLPLVLLLPSD